MPSAPLFPFQEDPGEAEPGNQEVPPARHLLPPLWKRPPPPRAARPGPRLRAAGPARLTGCRQPSPLRPRPPPSWRGRAALSRRHVRAAPAFPPAAGARLQGCGGRAQLPGILGETRRLCPPSPRSPAAERPRTRAALQTPDPERGFEARRGNDPLKLFH